MAITFMIFNKPGDKSMGKLLWVYLLFHFRRRDCDASSLGTHINPYTPRYFINTDTLMQKASLFLQTVAYKQQGEILNHLSFE